MRVTRTKEFLFASRRNASRIWKLRLKREEEIRLFRKPCKPGRAQEATAESSIALFKQHHRPKTLPPTVNCKIATRLRDCILIAIAVRRRYLLIHGVGSRRERPRVTHEAVQSRFFFSLNVESLRETAKRLDYK